MDGNFSYLTLETFFLQTWTFCLFLLYQWYWISCHENRYVVEDQSSGL